MCGGAVDRYVEALIGGVWMMMKLTIDRTD